MKRIYLILTLILLATGVVPAQKTFYSKEYKVGFKYPATLKLSKNPNEAEAPFTNPTDVSIRRPGRDASGTATVAAAKTTRDECKKFPSAGDDKPKRVKFGTTAFDKLEETDGGMESIQQFEFYRTYHNGMCYDVKLQFGMSKYPKRKLPERSLFNQLYAVLRTMYFR